MIKALEVKRLLGENKYLDIQIYNWIDSADIKELEYTVESMPKESYGVPLYKVTIEVTYADPPAVYLDSPYFYRDKYIGKIQFEVFRNHLIKILNDLDDLRNQICTNHFAYVTLISEIDTFFETLNNNLQAYIIHREKISDEIKPGVKVIRELDPVTEKIKLTIETSVKKMTWLFFKNTSPDFDYVLYMVKLLEQKIQEYLNKISRIKEEE